MKVAVEGCAHGELQRIYETLEEYELTSGEKVDLLLCCGDFQATRNWQDLRCMAVPDKYKEIGTFYKYYSGKKVAPVLTIFIGGNHEASNYLQELAYGGWVAPNIYYLGYASVINVGGLRIAGMSGIYKNRDFMQGHYEYPPYNNSTMRSAYHIRNLEVFRLKQLSGKIDVFLSHDWPVGITEHGNLNKLLRKKPFFKNDIISGKLGSAPAMEILQHHYPSHWFAAHLHCKFAAIIQNEDKSKTTKFLALDKCLPKRQFLQIIDIEHDSSLPIKLSYDLEWLTILFLTNNLLSVKNGICYMPGPTLRGRWVYTPTEEEKEAIKKKFSDLTVPLNFKMTVEPHNEESSNPRVGHPNLVVNQQTTDFCNKLGIDDPFVLLQLLSGGCRNTSDRSQSTSCTSSPSKINWSISTDGNEEVEDDSLDDEEEEENFEEKDKKYLQSPNFVIDKMPNVNAMKPIMSPLKLPPAKNNSTILLSDNDDSIENKSNSLKSPRRDNEEPQKNSINSDKMPNVSTMEPIMSPLKLPPPKNNSTILLSDDDDSIENKSNSLKSPRRSNEGPQETSTNNAADEVKNVPASYKKFKMRNHAIYTEVDDDDT